MWPLRLPPGLHPLRRHAAYSARLSGIAGSSPAMTGVVVLFNYQTARRLLRSPDGIGGLQAAVLKDADATHRLWRNPGLTLVHFADSAPDFASLHPGYKQTRLIAPCFGPGASRFFFSPSENP